MQKIGALDATLISRMRDARGPLGFALWAFGAALLAVAAIDFFAYEFVIQDLLFHEVRRHPPLVPDIVIHDPWAPRYWFTIARETTRGAPLLACGALGLTAAAAAWVGAKRRAALSLLALAAACAAAILAIAGQAAVEYREGPVMRLILEIEPGVHLRWLWPDSIYTLAPWDFHGAEALAAVLSALLVPATLFAALRVARARGWSRAHAWLTIGALGLPAAIAAGVLGFLWIHFGHDYDVARKEFEAWADFVQSGRLVPLGVAVLVALFAWLGRRSPDAPRLLPAAGLLCLGVAAALATTPHRRAIDSLYPLVELGGVSTQFHDLSAPWTFDPPRADGCAWDHRDVQEAAIRLDAGELVLELAGVRAPLVGRATVAALDGADERGWWGGDELRSVDLGLLVDRRVPAAALLPFLAQIPATDVERVVVHGAFIQERPWARGRVQLWTICGIGVLDLGAFVEAARTSDATWGDLVQDPALVRWRRPASRGPLP